MATTEVNVNSAGNVRNTNRKLPTYLLHKIVSLIVDERYQVGTPDPGDASKSQGLAPIAKKSAVKVNNNNSIFRVRGRVRRAKRAFHWHRRPPSRAKLLIHLRRYY
jgi:hypothetical protein